MTDSTSTGPLSGTRVIDASTVYAGPLAAQLLGDFGADVIKIEHPVKGDSLRGHGHQKDGVPLWWKVVARNKRCLGLDLGDPDGADIFCRLIGDADVLIENFRPGTLERWGLGPDRLHQINADLVVVRVTGFGQTGPYAARPAFGTLAEAMSGFAAMTGAPDGPPTLPPFGLADGISGISAALSAVLALYHRAVAGDGGQVVDLAIIEPLIMVLGSQPTAYDQLGIVDERLGNRSSNNAPRNTYRTRDGKWLAISTSATSIAERVLRLVGHPEVTSEPWFGSGAERAQHADLLDGYVSEWISARDADDVIAAFAAADAAIAPVYDIADLFDDPQIRHRDTFTTVADPDLGPVRMQNVLFRMSKTPGSIRHTGRPLGADTDQILRYDVGMDPTEIAELRKRGVVA